MSNTKELSKGEKTKLRIIYAAKKLFGTKSYDFVTTRMIAAEAGCSQSAISFYFETKENLCSAVVDDIINYHNIYYGPILKAYEEASANGKLSHEHAMQFIQQYIQCQVSIAFDKKNRYALNFTFSGQVIPEKFSDRINQSALTKFNVPFAKLLTEISDIPFTKALIYSTALTNSIIAFPFVEKSLLEFISKTDERHIDVYGYDDSESLALKSIQQYMVDYCLAFVRSISNQ